MFHIALTLCYNCLIYIFFSPKLFKSYLYKNSNNAYGKMTHASQALSSVQASPL